MLWLLQLLACCLAALHAERPEEDHSKASALRLDAKAMGSSMPVAEAPTVKHICIDDATDGALTVGTCHSQCAETNDGHTYDYPWCYADEVHHNFCWCQELEHHTCGGSSHDGSQAAGTCGTECAKTVHGTTFKHPWCYIDDVKDHKWCWCGNHRIHEKDLENGVLIRREESDSMQLKGWNFGGRKYDIESCSWGMVKDVHKDGDTLKLHINGKSGDYQISQDDLFEEFEVVKLATSKQKGDVVFESSCREVRNIVSKATTVSKNNDPECLQTLIKFMTHCWQGGDNFEQKDDAQTSHCKA